MRAIVAGLLLLCLVPLKAAATSVDVTTWKVPWDHSIPRDPAVDSKGHVWFVGQGGDYIAEFDPATAAFRKFDLDPGTGPHNLIIGHDGAIWYAGNRAAHIGRLDPASGKIEKIAMPDPAAGDPHTLIEAGNVIWFTVQRGNFVGQLDMRSRKVSLTAVPTHSALPYGIVLQDGTRPWFAEFGSNKLGTIDPRTLVLSEVSLPREEARPRRVAFAHGRVWYVDYVGGRLGAYDPTSGKFEEWSAPDGNRALPYAMAADGRGRIWFVETGPQPNRLVGFDPVGKTFFNTSPIENARGASRNMVYHRGELWFGTDSNYLVRARLSD